MSSSVLDGSNVTNPSLDGYKDVEADNVTVQRATGTTNITRFAQRLRGTIQAKGHRYLHYRVYYVNDGGIATNNPNESRILTKSVVPPHTVTSLKNYLCHIEGVLESAESCLFASLSDKKAMNEAAQISLLGSSGPGVSALDPVALVVHSDRSVVVKQKNPLKVPHVQSSPNYVYYRLYSTKEEIPSKMAFKKGDSSMGRFDPLAIAPPHTVASVKACLLKMEGISSLSSATSQLFAVLNSEAPMRDKTRLRFLKHPYPGCAGDNPMAFVVDAPQEYRVKSKYKCDRSTADPSWLSIAKGEVLTTNGIITPRAYRPNKSSGKVYDAYDAVNSSGMKGFVPVTEVELCQQVVSSTSSEYCAGSNEEQLVPHTDDRTCDMTLPVGHRQRL